MQVDRQSWDFFMWDISGNDQNLFPRMTLGRWFQTHDSSQTSCWLSFSGNVLPQSGGCWRQLSLSGNMLPQTLWDVVFKLDSWNLFHFQHELLIMKKMIDNSLKSCYWCVCTQEVTVFSHQWDIYSLSEGFRVSNVQEIWLGLVGFFTQSKYLIVNQTLNYCHKESVTFPYSFLQYFRHH